MLYDPKWEKNTEAKTDPLTLGALIAWLEQQPPDQKYSYGNPCRCLAHQYNASIGRSYTVVDLLTGDPKTFDWMLEDIACDSYATFGSALARARLAAGP